METRINANPETKQNYKLAKSEQTALILRTIKEFYKNQIVQSKIFSRESWRVENKLTSEDKEEENLHLKHNYLYL